MAKHLIKAKNSLTKEQKKEMTEKVEKIMRKYEQFINLDGSETSITYFAGVTDGLNHASKIINEVLDDYSLEK